MGGGLDSDEVRSFRCCCFAMNFPSSSNFHFTSAQPQLFINFFLCLFQDESGSLSSGESDIGVDDDEDELLDDDDMEDGRGEGRDDGSQANSLNDSDNDF